MLLNFPLVRLSDNIKASINPLFTPCPAKGGIKCAASPIIVMGNGRLLFQDLSKGNIRVANPTKDVKRIVLCSVRPNRKIFFSGENQRHYFCFENLPAFGFSIHQVFLKLIPKMQCTIIIGVSK